MKVRLIAKTTICDEDLRKELQNFDGPESLIMYCARVSNPNNQSSNNPKLLSYCADHGHWSVFEMADMIFEIETSRMIAPQILRHWSFSFQEFSQRYAAVDSTGIELYAARRQDKKNRQNSVSDIPQDIQDEWQRRQDENWVRAFEHYTWAISKEIAKECARAVLPLQTRTKMYMKGSLRDWIHYLTVRCDEAAQKEHRDIAVAIRDVLSKELPILAEAVGWIDSSVKTVT